MESVPDKPLTTYVKLSDNIERLRTERHRLLTWFTRPEIAPDLTYDRVVRRLKKVDQKLAEIRSQKPDSS